MMTANSWMTSRLALPLAITVAVFEPAVTAGPAVAPMLQSLDLALPAVELAKRSTSKVKIKGHQHHKPSKERRG